MDWMVLPLIPVALLIGWWLGRLQTARRMSGLRDALSEKTTQLQLAEERERMQAQLRREQAEALERQQQQFENTFKALSADALSRNTEQFIALATQAFGKLQEGARGDLEQRRQAVEALVRPLRESLRQVDEILQAVEQARAGAYAGLQDQIRILLDSQNRLQGETKNLVHALKTPGARGRWGELQLERTVEFAGMTEHIEFIKQVHVAGDEGILRPDLVVRLPGGKQIVIDAKAPLDAYLKALECEDRERETAFLEQHAAQIRAHIRVLAGKRYWRQFESTPEFVVMFLPGEVFFSAALEQDPGLIEYGSAENVLLATPTTLIALLKAAAYGWRQEAIAERAREITQIGRELYDRLVTQAEHFEDLGKSLARAVESYNKSLRSLESRVLVTARKFETLAGDAKKPLPRLADIAQRPIGDRD